MNLSAFITNFMEQTPLKSRSLVTYQEIPSFSDPKAFYRFHNDPQSVSKQSQLNPIDTPVS